MGLKELLITIAIVVFLLIVIFEWRLCVASSRNEKDKVAEDEEQMRYLTESRLKKEQKMKKK